ncbi:MAG: hypothetical protein ACREP8_05345 [Candidatus Binatia bacterium]
MILSFLKYFGFGLLSLGLKLLWPGLPLDIMALVLAAAVLADEGLWLGLSVAGALALACSAFSGVDPLRLAAPWLVAVPLFCLVKKYLRWGPRVLHVAALIFFASFAQVYWSFRGTPGIEAPGWRGAFEIGFTAFVGACLCPWALARLHRALRRFAFFRRRSARLNVLGARFGDLHGSSESSRGPFGWNRGL